ncbi:MAG: ribbon-helix-helix protein, CopG family [Kineosporiaceae bacterium]|nr:ribbon-helix-helix protein, CopG family [Aeromicrobium sp.]
MPNQPKTPTRVFRIDDALYSAAKSKAESEGRTLSEVVREALTLYVGASEV